MEQIKLAVQNKSFWNSESEIDLLPESNLIRREYLNRLNAMLELNLVITKLGQRRVGKSVLARQLMHQLRQSELPAKNILYLNFFLKELAPLKEEKLFIKISRGGLMKLRILNCPDI